MFITNYYRHSLQRARQANNSGQRYRIRVGSSLINPANFLPHYLNPQARANFNFNLVPVASSFLSANILFNNLGQHVDIVGDIYDQTLLNKYHCNAVKLADLQFQIVCPFYSSLAQKVQLKPTDLAGQTVNIFYSPANSYLHKVRKVLKAVNCTVIEWPYLTSELFNSANDRQELAITTPLWHNLAPFSKVVPVDWQLTVPYGIIYSQKAPSIIQHFIDQL